MRMIDDCRYHLVKAGIPMPDADQLRRIAMTLHRWHELECGDGNAHGSWCVSRGKKDKGGAFEYDDNGAPYMEYHSNTASGAHYTRIPDRERGALKRLGKIMARYPGFQAYVQGDPRGASLYILRPGDVPAGESADAYYTRGIAVHK
jgi:hypothetical protein